MGDKKVLSRKWCLRAHFVLPCFRGNNRKTEKQSLIIMQNKKSLWRITCILVVLFTAMAFSPLVIPPGKFEPELFGLPYTLWTGIGVSLILVILTLVGTKLHPGDR